MNFKLGGGARATGAILFVCALPLFGGLGAACGGSSPGSNSGHEDDRFAVGTNDEYTEALTNAVIGTPTGVITVDGDGGVGAPVPEDAGAAETGMDASSAPDAIVGSDDGSA